MKFTRSRLLFLGVVAVLTVAGLLGYGTIHSKIRQHPATLSALDIVRNAAEFQDAIGEPLVIGGRIYGEGFLRREDAVSARIPLSGPLGTAEMVMDAHYEDGIWNFEVLKLESIEGEVLVDLVSVMEAEQLRIHRSELLSRLRDGRDLMNRGDYEDAIEIFAALHEDYPNHTEPVRRWGLAAYLQSDFDEAELRLDQALRMLVQEGTDGDYAMDTGTMPDWGELIAGWTREGEYDPLSRWLEAVEALGMVYLAQERSTDCIELFTTVLNETGARDLSSLGDGGADEASDSPLPPQVAAAWYHRARCYLLQDMWDSARVGALTACVTGNPPAPGACELAEELR